MAAVRDFDHQSFGGMGYRAERHELGTFWGDDEIRTLGSDPARLPDLLAEARSYYGGRQVSTQVSGQETDRRLGSTLVAAGCEADAIGLAVAHVASSKGPPRAALRVRCHRL